MVYKIIKKQLTKTITKKGGHCHEKELHIN